MYPNHHAWYVSNEFVRILCPLRGTFQFTSVWIHKRLVTNWSFSAIFWWNWNGLIWNVASMHVLVNAKADPWNLIRSIKWSLLEHHVCFLIWFVNDLNIWPSAYIYNNFRFMKMLQCIYKRVCAKENHSIKKTNGKFVQNVMKIIKCPLKLKA